MDLQEVNIEKAKNVSNIIILKRNKEDIGLKLLDALYWKPKSVVWRIINIAIFALALLVSFVIPFKAKCNFRTLQIFSNNFNSVFYSNKYNRII